MGFVSYYRWRKFYTYFNSVEHLKQRGVKSNQSYWKMKRRHKFSESYNDNSILQKCVLQRYADQIDEITSDPFNMASLTKNLREERQRGKKNKKLFI